MLYDRLVEAIKQHDLGIELNFAPPMPAPWIVLLPRQGHAIVQATHVYGLNPLDPRSISDALADARRQAEELVRALGRLPELKDIRMVRTAPALGVRESRRVRGRYRLDVDDLLAGRKFDDGVTTCRFPIDIHALKRGEDGAMDQVQPYEVPYRCLVPEKTPGVLVAGRCISGSHEAHASYRVTGTCMGMGMAAGLAAALAVERGVDPAKIDGVELRQRLIERGVSFDTAW